MDAYQPTLDAITRYLIFISAPIAIGSPIAMIVFIILSIKTKIRCKDIIITFAVLTVVGATLVSILFYRFETDVANESYVVYEGDFHYAGNMRRSSQVWPLGAREEVWCYRGNNFPDGDYTGRVVYLERSKWVVDIEGTPIPESSE